MAARASAAPTLFAVAAAVAAIVSAIHSGTSVRDRLDSERATYAGMSSARRAGVPLAGIGVPGDVFAFYARYVAPGDRVYLQVGARSAAFAAAASFELLPATVTTALTDATVVLSYDEDPSLLHTAFVTQRRDGSRDIYVSRIGNP